jgi:hypothetical protein
MNAPEKISVEDALVVELKCVQRLATNTRRNVSIICEPHEELSACW